MITSRTSPLGGWTLLLWCISLQLFCASAIQAAEINASQCQQNAGQLNRLLYKIRQCQTLANPLPVDTLFPIPNPDLSSNSNLLGLLDATDLIISRPDNRCKQKNKLATPSRLRQMTDDLIENIQTSIWEKFKFKLRLLQSNYIVRRQNNETSFRISTWTPSKGSGALGCKKVDYSNIRPVLEATITQETGHDENSNLPQIKSNFSLSACQSKNSVLDLNWTRTGQDLLAYSYADIIKLNTPFTIDDKINYYNLIIDLKRLNIARLSYRKLDKGIEWLLYYNDDLVLRVHLDNNAQRLNIVYTKIILPPEIQKRLHKSKKLSDKWTTTRSLELEMRFLDDFNTEGYFANVTKQISRDKFHELFSRHIKTGIKILLTDAINHLADNKLPLTRIPKSGGSSGDRLADDIQTLVINRILTGGEGDRQQAVIYLRKLQKEIRDGFIIDKRIKDD